jgi:hypothetical protein
MNERGRYPGHAAACLLILDLQTMHTAPIRPVLVHEFKEINPFGLIRRTIRAMENELD